MRLAKFALLSLLIAASGCATMQEIDWSNNSEISSSIKAQYDEFKKVTDYVGPNFPGNWLGSNIFLRAWKYDADPKPQYQIYVSSYHGGDWRYYDRAYDSDGVKLDTVVIDREVGSCSDYGGCSFHEHVGVNVDKGYLENHMNSGIRFKVEGNGGEEVFSLPAAYIAAFLNRVGS